MYLNHVFTSLTPVKSSLPLSTQFYVVFTFKKGRKKERKLKKIANGTSQKEVGRRDEEESQMKHKVPPPQEKTNNNK